MAVDLEEFTGEPVEFSGPFGLRAAMMLKVGDCYTTVTPDFSNGFKLYYDTDKTTKRYQPLSIGDVNGFNNEQSPLPETFEEIVKVFTRISPMVKSQGGEKKKFE